MIGAFAAFGVDFNLAVLAVLSYRAISFWLPTLPGASPTSSCAARSRAGATSRARCRAARATDPAASGCRVQSAGAVRVQGTRRAKYRARPMLYFTK